MAAIGPIEKKRRKSEKQKKKFLLSETSLLFYSQTQSIDCRPIKLVTRYFQSFSHSQHFALEGLLLESIVELLHEKILILILDIVFSNLN